MPDDHPLARLETYALVGIGGFAGANLRYAATGPLPDVAAILLVNVVGSAVLGFLVYEARYTGIVDRPSRVVFATGFLSSLTTYSTFAMQVALAPSLVATAAIVAGNYGLGIGAVLVGREAARRLAGGERP